MNNKRKLAEKKNAEELKRQIKALKQKQERIDEQEKQRNINKANATEMKLKMSKTDKNSTNTMDMETEPIIETNNDNGHTASPDNAKITAKKNESNMVEIKYKPTDKGPYVVFLESESINVVRVGKMLRQLNITELFNIDKIGKSRVRVEAKNFKVANKILESKQINVIEKYKTFVPMMFVQTVVMVDDIPTEIPISEVNKELQTNVPIIKLERMNRWNNEEQKVEPCNKIKLTLRTTSLPNKITMYGANVRFDYYIPAPIICKKCLRYGHIAKLCRQTYETCLNCVKTHDETADKCPNPINCKYCNEPHKTTDAKCKERVRQKRIKRIMVTKRIPYHLAVVEEKDDSRFPQQHSGHMYSEIAKME